MISTAASASIFDYSAMLADISKSVASIKAAGGNAQPVFQNMREAAAEQPSGVFSLSGFAVSYLEPQSLFSVQRFASTPEEAASQDARPNRGQILDKEEKADAKEAGQTSAASAFEQELFNAVSQSGYQTAAKAYAGFNTASAAPVTYFADNYTTPNSRYISGLYDYVKNINAAPEILIDLIHQNNRSYDYVI